MLDFNSIGRNIQKARLKSGQTQEDIAEKLDMTPDYISKIETGAKHPSLPTLGKIAEVVGADVASFFPGTDPQKSDYGFNDFFDLISDFEPETRILLLKTAQAFADVDKKVKESKSEAKKDAKKK